MIKHSPKILVFPKDKNPYQELLYSPLRKRGIEIKYIFPICSSQILSLLFMILSLIYYRLRGYKIFHLHWTGSFASPYKILRIFYSVYYLFILFYLKILGYKLVWTVHNTMPHENKYFGSLIERKFLSSFADAKIIHSSSTIEEMEQLKLNTDNTFVIPHGNYIGQYENTVSKEKARKYLGLNKKDFVFLFFGAIREYKGLDDLLPAFYDLTKKEKNARLVIAGNCSDLKLMGLIKKYEKILGRNLISKIEFIEDAKVQYYFNSADIAVLPFKKITTSGSVVLAMSFAKPVISPKIGALKEMPDNISFFYNIHEKNGLYKAMNKAIKNKIEVKSKGKNAFEYAQSLSWDKIAEKTYNLYESIL